MRNCEHRALAFVLPVEIGVSRGRQNQVSGNMGAFVFKDEPVEQGG